MASTTNIGIKVSEPNYDVLTAAFANLSFSSGLATTPVVKTGTFDITLEATDVVRTYEIPIDLTITDGNKADWIPIAIGYVTFQNTDGDSRRYRSPVLASTFATDDHALISYTGLNASYEPIVQFVLSRKNTSVAYGSEETFTVKYFIISILQF